MSIFKHYNKALWGIALLVSLVPYRCYGQDMAAQRRASEEFQRQFESLSAQDPASAITSAKQFLAANPRMDSTLRLVIYKNAVDVAWKGLRDDKLTASLIDEAVQQNPTNPYRFLLIGRKITLFKKTQSQAIADAFLEEQWPLAQKAGPMGKRYIFPQYSEMLKRTGKNKDREVLSRQLVMENLEILGNQSWILEELSDALLQNGQADEALGWAKLDFMICNYDDKSISDAVQLLIKTWTARDLSHVHIDAFTKAQQVMEIPNPLTEVKTPVISPEDLSAAQGRLKTKANQSRITLLLLNDQAGQAMLEARRLLLSDPTTSVNSQEVCRIFKATDLNLLRANAFLEYYKTGQGENPLTGFLKETARTIPNDAQQQVSPIPKTLGKGN